MLGWLRLAAAWASRLNRIRKLGSRANWAWRTLMATRRASSRAGPSERPAVPPAGRGPRRPRPCRRRRAAARPRTGPAGDAESWTSVVVLWDGGQAGRRGALGLAGRGIQVLVARPPG